MSTTNCRCFCAHRSTARVLAGKEGVLFTHSPERLRSPRFPFTSSGSSRAMRSSRALTLVLAGGSVQFVYQPLSQKLKIKCLLLRKDGAPQQFSSQLEC